MTSSEHASSPALDEALDRLYASAPADFVRVRKELVAELKAAGEATAAVRVADKQKPSKIEWAINRLARSQPALLRDFVAERERAAAAQGRAGDPAKLKSALEAYRERLGQVLHAVSRELDPDGKEVSPAERRKIAQTLETAASDTTSRQDLLRGRVGPGTRDADPIAALAADARVARAEPDEAREERRDRAEAERRAKAERQKELASAQKELASLEREVKKARDADERARKRLEEAREEAARTAEELEALEGRLGKARSSLRDLEDE